ncbi:MAG: 4-hydroxyphenylpyruvate dioxygenase, partial [Pseudoalteromonas sp.]|nr:4-hydroxyphenylpyruvate dioxygenase [Pseudoalteromonas sp.]
MSEVKNPLGLVGIEFTEYATPDADYMDKIFTDFGFSKLKKFKGKDIVHYNQNEIHFLLNNERGGFSAEFAKSHGPAICSMGWRVEDAQKAFEVAVERGAKPATDSANKDLPYPAIYGIGDSLIYFIDVFGDKGSIFENDFEDLAEQNIVEDKGFIR